MNLRALDRTEQIDRMQQDGDAVLVIGDAQTVGAITVDAERRSPTAREVFPRVDVSQIESIVKWWAHREVAGLGHSWPPEAQCRMTHKSRCENDLLR